MKTPGDEDPPLVAVISADEDAEHLRALLVHLAPMELAGRVRLWHAASPTAGIGVDTAWDGALSKAAVTLVFITPDLLASETHRARVEAALGRHGRGDSQLGPVRVRPTLKGVWPELDGLSSLPSTGEWVTTRPQAEQEKAWVEVADAVRAHLGDMGSGPFGSDVRERDRHRSPLEDLMIRVRRVAESRDSKVRVSRASGSAPFLSYWRVVTPTRGRIEKSEPVGVLDTTPTIADVDVFVKEVLGPYRKHLPRTNGTLVHTGEPAPADVVDAANAEGVDVIHFSEYAGWIDFRPYVTAQTERLEADEMYPPSQYVEQRAARIVGNTQTVFEAAASELVRLLTRPGHAFVLVLATFGTGKTFLLHEAARRLGKMSNAPVPILIDLRELEKSTDVGSLVAAHFHKTGLRRFDFDAFEQMMQDGQIVLLFDGFDELAARVTYERAVEHFETLAVAANRCAKMVVTSRTEHFLTDDQVQKALGQRAERIYGRHLWKLEPFTETEIRSFLVRRLQDEEAANKRCELIRDVKDLLGLSENPRMLSFIADLPAEQLLAARERHGAITAATLYQLLLERWINFEIARAHPRGAKPGLDGEECWLALTALAEHLWRSGERAFGVDRLPESAAATMEALGPGARLEGKPVSRDGEPLQPGEVRHQVGSGTMLVRDEEGHFRFVHRSVMEFLVAWKAVIDLHHGLREELRPRLALLAEHDISPLMADFFADIAELLPPNRAVPWAQGIVRQGGADTLTRNARLVLKRKGLTPYRGAVLGKHQLEKQDFTAEDFRGADLAGANLVGCRFVRADLRDAQLQEAQLRDADLTRADLRGTDLRGADLDGARLLGADLRGAKLEGASFQQAVFAGAKLEQEVLAGVRVGRRGALMSPTLHWGFAESPHAHALVFLASGALVTVDRALRVWSIPQCAAGRKLELGVRPETVTVSADGATFVALTSNGMFEWNLQESDFRPGSCASNGLDPRVRASFSVVSADITHVGAVALSDDGGALAIVGDIDDRLAARLYREGHLADTTRVLALFHRDLARPDAPWVRSRLVDARALHATRLAVSPDGRSIAVGSEDHLAIYTVNGARHWYRALWAANKKLLFSRTGDTLISVGSAGVWTWDAKSALTGSKQVLGEWRMEFGADSVVDLACSPDGLLVAFTSGQGVLGLTVDGRLAFRLDRHEDSVHSVAFSHDGKLLASAARDGTVFLWSVPAALEGRNALLASLFIRNDRVAFTEDGRYKLWREEIDEQDIDVRLIEPGGRVRTILTDGREVQEHEPAAWHQIGPHRFELGELDEYIPGLRVPNDEPLFEMPE